MTAVVHDPRSRATQPAAGAPARARLVPVTVAGARATLANPSGLVVTGAFYLLVTLALSRVWVAAAGASGGMVAGYDASMLVWYIAAAEAVTIPIPIRTIDRMGADIVSRRFELELLRPASPMAVRLATEVGAMAPRLVLCATLGLGFAALDTGSLAPAGALALAAPALVLATVCNLVAMHGFAAGAFWLRETRSAWFIYQKLVFMLGGMLLPIEVLPDTVAAVARWLPFAAMAYVPARLASGHVEPALLATQLVWVVVLYAAARLVLAAGERRFTGTAR